MLDLLLKTYCLWDCSDRVLNNDLKRSQTTLGLTWQVLRPTEMQNCEKDQRTGGLQ